MSNSPFPWSKSIRAGYEKPLSVAFTAASHHVELAIALATAVPGTPTVTLFSRDWTPVIIALLTVAFYFRTH